LSRIRELLIEAKHGLDPWESVPDRGIVAIARQCGGGEVAEMLAELDTLSTERAETDDPDGDTLDEISKTQELYAKILGTVSDALIPDIAAGFQSDWPVTRHWVAIGLARHGEAAFPALREALEAETNAGVREFIENAVETLGG
jgi:hypothetical protein